MQPLTPTGQRLVDQLSQRYGISQDAVFHMLVAVNNGGGTMAQFNCPELGGGGQAAAPRVNFAQAPVAPEPVRPAPSAPALPQAGAGPNAGTGPRGGTDVIALIEQLARLRAAGVPTDDEFNSKKRELLDRL